MNLFHPAFMPAPSVIVGQSGEETAAPPISPSQNPTKCPGSRRLGEIVGQKRRYLPRMTHNDENCPARLGTKRSKAPQLRRRRGATDADDPRSGPFGRPTPEPRLTRMPHPRQTRASRRFPGPGTVINFLALPSSGHSYPLSPVSPAGASASCCYLPVGMLGGVAA